MKANEKGQETTTKQNPSPTVPEMNPVHNLVSPKTCEHVNPQEYQVYDPWKMAAERNIYFREERMPDIDGYNWDGMILLPDMMEQPCIVLNENLTEEEKHFACMCFIVWYDFNHDSKMWLRFGGKFAETALVEVNEILATYEKAAREMLAPDEDVRAFVAENGPDQRKLMKRFGLPEDQIDIRLKELGL